MPGGGCCRAERHRRREGRSRALPLRVGTSGDGRRELPGRPCPGQHRAPQIAPSVSGTPGEKGAEGERAKVLATPARRFYAPGLLMKAPGPACLRLSRPKAPSRCALPTTQLRHLFPVSIRFRPTVRNQLNSQFSLIHARAGWDGLGVGAGLYCFLIPKFLPTYAWPGGAKRPGDKWPLLPPHFGPALLGPRGLPVDGTAATGGSSGSALAAAAGLGRRQLRGSSVRHPPGKKLIN